jgi:DNA polymerase-3 subunit delta'
MPFDEVLGQPVAVETLRRAVSSRRLHHAYRFEGPAGVGKERVAFALAQTLVCTRGGAEACGVCSACKRAVTLSPEEPRVPQHPDVVLVERGLYPPGLLGRTSPETTGIGVEQVRRIVLGRAMYPAHEAEHLVFIFRAAHELTPSAANALLKTLEEPRRDVHFILITDQPRRLLDTVRSRTLPIRFGPLPDSTVTEILSRHGFTPSPEVIALAAGSAERALELCAPEKVAHRQEFVDAVLAAVKAPDLAAALELAARGQQDRNELARDLHVLAQHFALGARHVMGGDPASTLREAERHQEVQVALRFLERNAPPTLTLEALIARLRRL